MKNMLKILLGTVFTAMAVVLGVGKIDALAADIPYVQATGRDGIKQSPDASNNYEMQVILTFPKKVNGTYHQAVKLVLNNLDTGKKVSYCEDRYVTVKDGSATVEAQVPAWTITSRFGTPCGAGNYQIELYALSGPETGKLLFTCGPFRLGGDRGHHFEWCNTAIGSSTTVRRDTRQCMGCGKFDGETKTYAIETNYMKECSYLIDNAPLNGTVTLQHDIVNSYPRYIMEKIAKRRDINTIIYLGYQNKYYKVTIPANTLVNLSYEYYGPLLLQALFGAEEVSYNPKAIMGAGANMSAITQAASGDVVVLTGKDTYTRNDMLVISTRRDLTVVIKCAYKGTHYVITIPAGATIDTSVEYYGPLKLASLYPFTIANQ